MQGSPRSDPDRPGGPPRRRRLWAWGQLLRLPNLFTVPGDPLAGFLLAQAAGLSATKPGLRMALAALVSLLLYAAGLLWNDWFDLPEDRRERPDRPLPAGLIRPATVALAANVLVALAVAVAAVAGRETLYVAMALGAAVLVYDALAKRVRIVGPLLMGSCRGLSVLVGAAGFGLAGLRSPAVVAYAAGTTLYIAAVTWLASGETRRRPVGPQAGAIAAVAVAWLLGVYVAARPACAAPASCMLPAIRYCLWAGLAVVWVGLTLSGLVRRPEPGVVQASVGRLLCGLVLVQAAAATLAGPIGLHVALGLTACAVANNLLARRFYAS